MADSSILVIDIDKYYQGAQISAEDYRVIPVRDIYMIQFRAKNSKTLAISLGVAGMVAGTVVGLLSDVGKGAKPPVVFGCAVAGAAIGFGIGLPLSGIKRTIFIRGKVQTYREKRLEMIPYTIKYYTN